MKRKQSRRQLGNILPEIKKPPVERKEFGKRRDLTEYETEESKKQMLCGQRDSCRFCGAFQAVVERSEQHSKCF